MRPDEVPSLQQVANLARACPPGTTRDQWEGIVNTLAYGGLRIGELFALSASDTVRLDSDGLLIVQYQLVEPHGRAKCLAPPKNGYGRLVAICEATPTGHALRSWLVRRGVEAAQEREAGTNPAGALFVTPRGRWWTRSNFRTRCFNPAAIAAGWNRETWPGVVRRRRGQRMVAVRANRQRWTHTVHDLRHHYATTARDAWGWTGAELCLNGGWADEAFVLSRYYGSSAESYQRALAKQVPDTRDLPMLLSWGSTSLPTYAHDN